MYRVAETNNTMGLSFQLPSWVTGLVSQFTGAATRAQTAVTAYNAAIAPANQAPIAVNPVPTTLNISAQDENPVPSWVVPVGLGVLGVLLLMRQRQRS